MHVVGLSETTMARDHLGLCIRSYLNNDGPMQEPVPHVTAHPTHNMLEWHFVLEGAKGTDFEGGCYHGKITFPPQYPFKPPSLSLFTPNGRFAVNTKLCLSMTDYHPESWNPM
jgi:ubiquitin-conjugating enzyme E2 J2